MWDGVMGERERGWGSSGPMTCGGVRSPESSPRRVCCSHAARMCVQLRFLVVPQRTANPQIVPISVKKTEFSDHNYCCAGIFWPTHQVSMARCICPKLILRTGARNPCFSTRNPCDHPHCHASADMPPPPRDVNMVCPTTASNVYSLCVWATQRARYEVRAACGALSRVYRRGVDFEPSCTGMWCANECRSEHHAPISHGEISCRTRISWKIRLVENWLDVLGRRQYLGVVLVRCPSGSPPFAC